MAGGTPIPCRGRAERRPSLRRGSQDVMDFIAVDPARATGSTSPRPATTLRSATSTARRWIARGCLSASLPRSRQAPTLTTSRPMASWAFHTWSKFRPSAGDRPGQPSRAQIGTHACGKRRTARRTRRHGYRSAGRIPARSHGRQRQSGRMADQAARLQSREEVSADRLRLWRAGRRGGGR